jgi:putative hydrolase of the HAD superfamily
VPALRAVVLDYGNVLSLEQEGDSVRRLEGLAGAEAELFAEAYWRHRDEYDRGALAGEAYWQAVAADLGVELGPGRVQELIAEDAQSWLRLDDRMVAWLRALVSAGVPTGILSNMSHDTWSHARPVFDWLDGLAATVLSFEVGLIKPEPGIYLECLRRMDTEPGETLFVDDRPVNVEAARGLGIVGVVFEGADGLRAVLERLDGSLPLP